MLKRSEYPKELHIGTEIYKIKFVRKFKDKKTMGECDPEAKEIRIRCGLGPEETLMTLIHEVGHALFEFEHDIKIKHHLIYAFEKPLYQFLRDNVFRRAK